MRQLHHDGGSEESPEVTITVGALTRETDKAVMLSAPDGAPIWLPKSQIEMQPRLDGHGLDIILPRWLYDAKNMEVHGL